MPLVVLIVALLGVSAVDAVRNPTIRRLAMRNLTRRRGEAVLVVLGSLLGTAIITAAFIVGDTLGASVRDNARTALGPIDETIRVSGLHDTSSIVKDLAARPVPNTDGALAITIGGISVKTSGRAPYAEPFAGINEVDYDSARAFGGNANATGFANAGATPKNLEADISKELAKKLHAKAGDAIHVFGYAHAVDMTVRHVLPAVGVAGYNGRALFAAPGTITALMGANASPVSGIATYSQVLVSNRGGVFDGAKYSGSVTKQLRTRFDTSDGAEVLKTKQLLLDDADAAAKQFTTLFGTIGTFSVIAGILLLVNIFVMLADDRKSELGMLRAIGMKRNQLVRAFGMEGAVYALVSSVLGVVVGIGVGGAVARIASGIFGGDAFGGGLTIRLSIEPRSLLLGFVLGASIALVTVWGASVRVGRLNVIRAIRDIAEAPRNRTGRLRSYVLSAVGILIGLVLLRLGISNDNWFGALAGVPLASVSAITLLRAFLSRRVAICVGAGTALVWAIAVFSILPNATSKTDVQAFVVQGVILVGAAVAIVATNDDVATWFVSKLGVSRRTLAARLGFAYPLARVFRTSMLLGMFSIVVFTLTFLSVFSHLFSAQAPRFAREASAGYDLLVDSNYANPVPSSVLLGQPHVVADNTLDESSLDFTTPYETKRTEWEISGFDDALLKRGTPVLSHRAPQYKTDRDAWLAVLHDPSLAMLPDFFLQRGGPPQGSLSPGQRFTAYDRFSGGKTSLKVAGIIEGDFLFNGPMVSKTFLHSFTSQVTPSRHYVAVQGIAPERAAEGLKVSLINYGVKADTFEGLISERLSQQSGFLHLMQGYLALGLVIGIAGLGVVMVRAVRERRRQIGMLRAMGFPSRVVRQAFLIEATFLALQGIVLGTVLALVTSYNLLVHSDTFGGQNLHFEIPWPNILLVLVVALFGSLLASALPAGQASRIKPAVALRIAD
ncbi:MAG: putative transport system permease protein [Actinomycetota bacterium]